MPPLYADIYQNCHFPTGSWFKKREDSIVAVAGRNFRLLRVFYGSYSKERNAWKVLFDGVEVHNGDLNGDEMVVLRFRYQLPPIDRNTSKPIERSDFMHTGTLRREFDREIRCMQACHGSGHMPEYIAHEEHAQRLAEDPYPDGGLVLALVMTKLHGQHLGFYDPWPKPLFLTPDDMRSIRQQCVDALEYARQRGMAHNIGPDKIIFDPETKTVSLYPMDQFWFEEDQRSTIGLDSPITEESPHFFQFKSRLQDEWPDNDVEIPLPEDS
ncbi:hypothetical protein ASPZODRAFT_147389 [Penicilliopsis zonata CBS 506.65]|uniref:Protein kinase domain-containing protein n=1 Tax=Penicilliopsis zonata CBS 506.65 TaxID=1073090 RepID=A0A1L9S5G0_9EURO|nr:hypothetical protein ASPZODRAFT_147389 [Penicilliopsis zonata CBS 506.65]OJJ42403.1 hypothetical protein ASPZODRAFT_147389 [Penicilliopsis zonata CBS 506.65]